VLHVTPLVDLVYYLVSILLGPRSEDGQLVEGRQVS
jgi:UDP-N-acetyl-D-mannosaminuronic acid transferase (WecB/TagA/CpsF family)